MHCEPHTPILCKPGQACRGNRSLGHQPMLSQTWACQQLVKLSTFRILVLLRISVCPGRFLLTAEGVPAQQHPSAATGSLLTQTRRTKCSVNGNASRQLAAARQACRHTITHTVRSTRCFSLTRKPHACPTAGIVFCLLPCCSPARMLEHAGCLRVTFPS